MNHEKREKNKEIVSDWINAAVVIAKNKGFTRTIVHSIFLESYMVKEMAFYTTEEDKETVIEWMVADLILLENICKQLDAGEIHSCHSLKRMINCAFW